MKVEGSGSLHHVILADQNAGPTRGSKHEDETEVGGNDHKAWQELEVYFCKVIDKFIRVEFAALMATFMETEQGPEV